MFLSQLKTETSCKETHFNKISEDQHLKYLRKNSLLPAELSSMIGRIRVAIASLNKNLKEKEKVITLFMFRKIKYTIIFKIISYLTYQFIFKVHN